jgi:hypothetical protein
MSQESIIFVTSHWMDFTHIVVLFRYENREFLVNSCRRNKQNLIQMCSVDDAVHEYCCAIFLNHLGTWESFMWIMHCKIKSTYKTSIYSSTEDGHEKSSDLRFIKITYTSLFRTSQETRYLTIKVLTS